MGTFRGSAKDLMMPPGMIPEDDEEDDTDESFDTGASTKGSDPLNGVGTNAQASHSTVIIKPPVLPLSDADASGANTSSGKSVTLEYY